MNKIVCISGSTRFKNEILQVAKDLTLSGFIVVLPLVFGGSGDVITDEQKINLDELHKEKIKLADWLVVVSKDYYIGESTIKELYYAFKIGKPIELYFCDKIHYHMGKFQSRKNEFIDIIQQFSLKSQEIYHSIKENLQ